MLWHSCWLACALVETQHRWKGFTAFVDVSYLYMSHIKTKRNLSYGPQHKHSPRSHSHSDDCAGCRWLCQWFHSHSHSHDCAVAVVGI